ncbi:MAG: GIY-YIG nuclease family protein [Sphingomonadales bacterium]
MAKGGYTYIVTNKPFGILYVGVTADIAERMIAHRSGRGSSFVRKWGLHRLVLIEAHDRIEDAIAREKALKNWNRIWKLRLIAEQNPEWHDLFDTLNC